MKIWAKALLIVVTITFIFFGYLYFNLQHLSQTIGYDEVFYFRWVDDYKTFPTFYPHHLFFSASSSFFQDGFSSITGIDNTAFVQRFKNIFVTAIGLCVYFIYFFLYSRRYFLSLGLALLIGFSATVWGFAAQHETSLIPAILVNMAFLGLLFYKRFPFPHLFVVLFSIVGSAAILLHQAYIFMLPAGFAVFIFTKPDKNRNMKKNWLYAVLFGIYSFVLIGGGYFYVGHVKLNLALEDNDKGTQVYMSRDINGNFFRYFYLLKSNNIWGKEFKNKHTHTLNGFGRSFWIGFDTKKIDFNEEFQEDKKHTTIVWVFLSLFFGLMILFSWRMLKDHGALFPALLIWFIVGGRFVMWWEPWYIEHWTYLAIMAVGLFFLTICSVINLFKNRAVKAVVSTAFALVIFLFAGILFSWNFKDFITPDKRRILPSSASRSEIWKPEYSMDEILK